MKIAVYLLFSCIFALILVSPINGSCKRDLGLENGNETRYSVRDSQRTYTYTAASPNQPSSSSTLKFMTFNMQSGFLLSCQSNVAEQTSFIQSIAPDYIASEEVDVGVSTRCNCNIPQQIATAAGITSVFGMTLPYGTGLYGTNTGTSQIILETRYQLLAYSGVEQRIVVAVRTQPMALKGRNLWFATVHVEYYNDAARWSQISQIVTFLNGLMAADPNCVVVVGGDFNGGPWDQGYTEMQNGGFSNAWATFYGSINDGNTIPSDWPGSRFDHIWFKAPAGVTITVPQAVVPAVQLSDHRPFWAMLTFTVAGYAPPPPAPTQAPTQAPTKAPTLAPTQAPKPPTQAPTAPPVAPTQKPIAPTTAPTAAAPQQGSSACTAGNAGAMLCSADAKSYNTCANGVWLNRACASGLVCKSNGSAGGIYCDYP